MLFVPPVNKSSSIGITISQIKGLAQHIGGSMIKGCQRKIYHVKNPNSTIFDEAYFVLKKTVSPEYMPGIRHINDSEMADEAERIIRDLCRECPRNPSALLGKMSRGGAFVLGAVSSSAVIGTLALLLVYL